MNIPLISQHLDLLRLPEHNAVRRALGGMWHEITRAVNGRLTFGSPAIITPQPITSGNIDGVWPGTLASNYTITTPGAANTEFTVTHNLGRIPVGYDVKSKDRAGQIYDSRKASWTTTQMFLKADTASMNIAIFVH